MYPQRESHFAHKVTRLLFKSCACQDMGHYAVLLVCHVAHTEDAARYQGPVRFWNSQLMETLGFKSPKQLTDARRRAIERGWLNYEREHDRAVGYYWTAIPASVVRFDDAPIEENSLSASGTENGNEGRFTSASGTGTGMGTGMGTGKPSIPIPIPIPKESAAIAAVPAGLLELIDCWNQNCPPGRQVRKDRPPKAVLDGWKRVAKDRELRESLADLDGLGRAIKKATWARGQSWFVLESLFQKDIHRSNWKATRLLRGDYDARGDEHAAQKPKAPSPYLVNTPP